MMARRPPLVPPLRDNGNHMHHKAARWLNGASPPIKSSQCQSIPFEASIHSTPLVRPITDSITQTTRPPPPALHRLHATNSPMAHGTLRPPPLPLHPFVPPHTPPLVMRRRRRHIEQHKSSTKGRRRREGEGGAFLFINGDGGGGS